MGMNEEAEIEYVLVPRKTLNILLEDHAEQSGGYERDPEYSTYLDEQIEVALGIIKYADSIRQGDLEIMKNLKMLNPEAPQNGASFNPLEITDERSAVIMSHITGIPSKTIIAFNNDMKEEQKDPSIINFINWSDKKLNN